MKQMVDWHGANIKTYNCLSFTSELSHAFCKTILLLAVGRNIVNATKHSHGPSWRMIVHLTDKIEAYGVYPGGQSGNPGSKYYDSFVDQWAAGKYYTIWFMHAGDKLDKKAKWKMTFDKI